MTVINFKPTVNPVVTTPTTPPTPPTIPPTPPTPPTTVSTDDTRYVLDNSSEIDSVLHCVVMVSNPCLYKRRYQLAKEFLAKPYPGMIIYLVEVIYKDQVPGISDKTNPRHLQIYTDSPPLWHKENAINIGISKLLPKDWKAVAWIDADIEFENNHWVQDTLKLLNRPTPVVCQLFSHALDLNINEDPMTIFQGFGYQSYLGKQHGKPGLLFWHPGYAWACNRVAYDTMGGLYERSILGSGDHNMALSFINKGIASVNSGVTNGYKNHVLGFQKRVQGFLLRYTPGVIRHFYHGSKKSRQYQNRWTILVNHKYDPIIHVFRNKDGLLVPSSTFPSGLVESIYAYFSERLEDD